MPPAKKEAETGVWRRRIRPPSTRILVVIASLLTSLVGKALGAPPPRVSVPEFRRLAILSAADFPDAQPAVERSRAASVVLFIPGALGSRLTRGGTVIWGEGPASVERLALREGDDAKPELLLSYGVGVTQEDIYGRFRSKLTEVLTGKGEFRDFPYDWRRSIRETADNLDRVLRAEASPAGKEVFLIAHSMGGLVAWDWQSRHYRGREQDDLKVHRMLLLGSPLGGSCEIIRMLANAYEPSPDAGKVEKVVYHALFKGMRGAAFTFPGIFELLPPVSPGSLDETCLTSALEPPEMAPDYFHPAFWQTPAGLTIVQQAWAQFGEGMSEAAFFDQLAKVVATARSFREQFDLRTLRVPTVLFFTPGRQTVAHARIEWGGLFGSTPKIRYRTQMAGDGRVLKRSAINYGNARPDDAVRLSLPHGDLPRDPIFIDYAGDELLKSIEAVSALHLLRALDASPAYLEAYRQRGGGILAAADLRPFLSPDLAEPTTALAGRLTDRLLAQAGVEDPYMAGRAAQAAGRARPAVPLIESALRAPEGVDPFDEPFALNRLGYALLLEKNYKAALPWLKAAVDALDRDPESYAAYKAERANTLSNLGVAYYHLGQCDAAKRSLERAVPLGSATAKRYLTFRCFPSAVQ